MEEKVQPQHVLPRLPCTFLPDLLLLLLLLLCQLGSFFIYYVSIYLNAALGRKNRFKQSHLQKFSCKHRNAENDVVPMPELVWRCKCIPWRLNKNRRTPGALGVSRSRSFQWTLTQSFQSSMLRKFTRLFLPFRCLNNSVCCRLKCFHCHIFAS